MTDTRDIDALISDLTTEAESFGAGYSPIAAPVRLIINARDALVALREENDQLNGREEFLTSQLDAQTATANHYREENERLRKHPTFDEYVAITDAFLDHYPSDIFNGSSGDPGPTFIVRLREARATLPEPRRTEGT